MEQKEPGEQAPDNSDDDHFWRNDAPGEPYSPSFWDHLTAGGDDSSDDPPDPTAPLPLPPADRLWRHPSELRNKSSVSDDADAATTLDVDSQGHRKGILLTAIAAGLTGALVAGAAVAILGPTSEVVTERVIERQLIQPATTFLKASLAGIDVVGIAEAVRPSIVRIEVLNSVDTVISSGSGVIFRDDGHVLTNSHVVSGSIDIEVIMSDGRRHRATLIGADPLTDVAVVKINGDEVFPAVLMGSTDTLRVGEPAIAVGSPLRLAGGPTVTAGIVSAIGRTLDLPDGGRLFDLVQTDAPISPGSSGGALLNGSGALIGLTTIIAVSDVGAEGLGFATPVEVAYDVAVDLVLDGEVSHGFLGVSGDDVDGGTATQVQLDGGALITTVGDDTPAAAAGIREGDIVVAVNGTSIHSMGDLVVMIRRIDPGTMAEITVVRESDQLVMTARISTRP